MALTKSDIIQNISTETGLTKKQSTETVESVLQILKSTLASGEDIWIGGFGKFCVKEKNEWRGRNPVTGSDMPLPTRKVVTFKWSERLRGRIKGKRKIIQGSR